MPQRAPNGIAALISRRDSAIAAPAIRRATCSAREKPATLMPARSIDNWIAPALTAANPSPAPWTPEELYAYLRNGVSVLHGTAAGPMSPVVHGSCPRFPNSDVRAHRDLFRRRRHSGGPLAVHRSSGGGAGDVLCGISAQGRFIDAGHAPLHGRLRVLPLQRGQAFRAAARPRAQQRGHTCPIQPI